MEDGLAREGVLARCNQESDASKIDAECDNARRAAAAIAAADPDEAARLADLERQSKRKMLALREHDVRTRQVATQAAADARAQSDAEYEAQWARQAAGHTVSMTDADFDFVPYRPPLHVAALTPPTSDVTIVAPELDIKNVAIVPRPFLAADTTNGR